MLGGALARLTNSQTYMSIFNAGSQAHACATRRMGRWKDAVTANIRAYRVYTSDV